VTGRDRVFVDANELLPFSVMDLLLSLAEDLLIDFVWSDELIDEWERVIVREGRRTSETARAVSDAVRRFFATTRIDPLAYRFSGRSPRPCSPVAPALGSHPPYRCLTGTLPAGSPTTVTLPASSSGPAPPFPISSRGLAVDG